MASVTVVVPTTGRPSLRRAVDSALAQTYRDVEVVVVFDGESRELPLIQDRLPPGVNVLATGKRSNANVARCLGISSSGGDIIALLDDDDVWYPNKLSVQVPVLLEQGSGLVVSGTLYRVAGRYSGEIWPARAPRNSEAFGDYLFRKTSLGRVPTGFQTSTIMATRSVFDRIPLDSTRRVHQDWDWLLRVAGQPDISILLVDKVLSEYAISDALNGASLTGSTSWEDSVEWCMEKNVPLAARARGDFLLTVALNRAADSGSLRGVGTVLWRALTAGSPGPWAWVTVGPRILRSLYRRSHNARN